MRQIIISIFVLVIILFILGVYTQEKDREEEYQIPIESDLTGIEQPEFLLHETPNEVLMEALEYYNVKHRNIVYAQAILETGHFRSKICREYNNLFGLYNSYTGDYYKFDHWSESIIGYLKYIQYKYHPPSSSSDQDYYRFLEEIGYAEDPLYINKLKSIRYEIDKDAN